MMSNRRRCAFLDNILPWGLLGTWAQLGTHRSRSSVNEVARGAELALGEFEKGLHGGIFLSL